MNKNIERRLTALEATSKASTQRPDTIELVGVERDANGELVEVSRCVIWQTGHNATSNTRPPAPL